MQQNRKHYWLMPLAAVLPPLAQAANTATLDIPMQGSIVQSLEVSLVNRVEMPNVVKPAAGEPNTSVELTCNSNGTSSVTYSGNGNPYAHGVASAATPDDNSANKIAAMGGSVRTTGRCAELTVTGQSGYYYTATSQQKGGGPGTMHIQCNADQNGGGQIGVAGSGLYCGAKVTVNSAATPTGYSSGPNLVVTVTYD